MFFDSEDNARITADRRGKKRYPGTVALESVVNGTPNGFLDLVNRCFDWNPATRITPDEAMSHPWIQEAFAKNSSFSGKSSA
jgi:dual specificity tyrosine-phosphorylation-regulated kinase 2/3/4